MNWRGEILVNGRRRSRGLGVGKVKHAFEKDLCAELDELEGRNPSKW